MKTTYCITDLHGRFDLLQAALSEIDNREPGNVVFTGDYVERGPESRQIIERVMDGPARKRGAPRRARPSSGRRCPHSIEGRTDLDTFAWATGRLVVGVSDDGEPGGPVDLIEIRLEPDRRYQRTKGERLPRRPIAGTSKALLTEEDDSRTALGEDNR